MLLGIIWSSLVKNEKIRIRYFYFNQLTANKVSIFVFTLISLSLQIIFYIENIICEKLIN